MAFLGLLLFITGAISIIYPLRFLYIPNRLAALAITIVGVTVLATSLPEQPKTNSSQTSNSEWFKSSGGCKTDFNGDLKCEHSSSTTLFGTTSTSTSSMKCGQNPVTLAYECKSDSRSY